METILELDFSNVLFCLVLLLGGTFAKFMFDDLKKGTTTKVINIFSFVLCIIFSAFEDFQLIVFLTYLWSALAFQRAFKLFFHYVEFIYVSIIVKIIDWIENLIDKKIK